MRTCGLPKQHSGETWLRADQLRNARLVLRLGTMVSVTSDGTDRSDLPLASAVVDVNADSAFTSLPRPIAAFAALALFASVGILFWYILQIVMSFSSRR